MRKSYFICFEMAPFCFSNHVGLWWWHQLVRHLHLDFSAHNKSTPNAPHKTTPSSIFPTLLSWLLSQAQGLNCPPYFPESSMVQSPEDCTLAVFYDSVPHFKIHSQHQSARLHYLLKNKLKQLCFMIYLKNYVLWLWSLIIISATESEK